MVARHCYGSWVRWFALAAALTAAGWPAAPCSAAGELDKLDTSLKLIPADAAFYSSMLRGGEQFQALRKSNVWAKIEAMPVVQMGLTAYRAQQDTPDSGPAKIEAALKNPETRKMIDLAADMASNEMFVYGEESCIDFLELLQDVNMAMSHGPLAMQATGQFEGPDPSKVHSGMIMSALAQHVDLIGMPGFVVGFKLKNPDLAKEELIKLEMFANFGLQAAGPLMQDRFKKTKVGDHEYLVLNLDGGMVPWDMLPMGRLEDLEAKEGDAQKIIDRLKKAKLVIALGLRGNYLLAAVGPSLSCLEKLGKGGRLIDRAEFKPLLKHADKRLTSISYLSEDMNQQLNNQQKQIESLQDLVNKVLPKAKLTGEQKDRIQKDVAGLVRDVKGMIPAVGANMALSFLCDRGVEGYQYAWGKHGGLDGAKPLGLLQHVGGNPILGVVARQKMDVKQYDLMVKWAKTGYGYFEEFGLPNIPEADRAKTKKFLDAALPLVARMDKANREMLLPALADGQLALVIDGKLTSKQFCQKMPPMEKPMPMVEPALVVGVSDAKQLQKALGEYRSIANGLIDAARQIEGSNVPENIRIPEPQKTEGPLGTTYSFALPKEWGVDERISPNIGISDDVAVFSMSPPHTARLLKATPLAVGGLLSQADRPLAAAVWFNWAGLVEAATPWVDFAVVRAVASGGGGDDEEKSIADQVHVVIDVLKAVQSITAESYFEDGVLVVHTLVGIRDVAK